MKVGLLTNEIPPIVYGGVSTWILNFMDMFDDDDDIEIYFYGQRFGEMRISPNDLP